VVIRNQIREGPSPEESEKVKTFIDPFSLPYRRRAGKKPGEGDMSPDNNIIIKQQSIRDISIQQDQAPEITWTAKAPLTHNPQMVPAYLVMFGFACIIGLLLSLYTGNFILIAAFMTVMSLFIGLFILISCLVDILTGGGLEIQGRVSREGAAHLVGGTTRSIDQGISLINTLSLIGKGRTGLSLGGGGFITRAQENQSIAWNEVRSVRIWPKARLIVLRDITGIFPVGLYCTAENFSQVLDIVRRNVSDDVIIRES
jgi:hypothetical protein